MSKWPAQKTPAKLETSIQAPVPQISFPPSLNIRTSSHVFIVSKRVTVRLTVQKRITLIEGTQEEPKPTDDPKSEESDEVEEIAVETDGALLLVQQESIPTVKKKWLRKNIFRSTGTIHRENCTVVIDGGSCENIIS